MEGDVLLGFEAEVEYVVKTSHTKVISYELGGEK